MTRDTQLLRQVHPSFVQAGHVTSQAFRPTHKDDWLLSVYDGDLITAEDAWVHFTSQGGCTSAGVMGVTCDECAAEGLTARPDPEPFPEHAVIDFTGFSDNQREKKSKKLKAKAEARNWMYQAPAV